MDVPEFETVPLIVTSVLVKLATEAAVLLLSEAALNIETEDGFSVEETVMLPEFVKAPAASNVES